MFTLSPSNTPDSPGFRVSPCGDDAAAQFLWVALVHPLFYSMWTRCTLTSQREFSSWVCPLGNHNTALAEMLLHSPQHSSVYAVPHSCRSTDKWRFCWHVWIPRHIRGYISLQSLLEMWTNSYLTQMPYGCATQVCSLHLGEQVKSGFLLLQVWWSWIGV